MTKAQEAELIAIAAQHNGVLTPAHVIASAQDPANPLHSHFMWDDSRAAHAYRLQQARQLIAVAVTVLPNTTQEVRAFVSLSDHRSNKNGGGYGEIGRILGSEEQRAKLLSDAFAELHRIRAKYGSLKELAAIFEALDEVEVA